MAASSKVQRFIVPKMLVLGIPFISMIVPTCLCNFTHRFKTNVHLTRRTVNVLHPVAADMDLLVQMTFMTVVDLLAHIVLVATIVNALHVDDRMTTMAEVNMDDVHHHHEETRMDRHHPDASLMAMTHMTEAHHRHHREATAPIRIVMEIHTQAGQGVHQEQATAGMEVVTEDMMKEQDIGDYSTYFQDLSGGSINQVKVSLAYLYRSSMSHRPLSTRISQFSGRKNGEGSARSAPGYD